MRLQSTIKVNRLSISPLLLAMVLAIFVLLVGNLSLWQSVQKALSISPDKLLTLTVFAVALSALYGAFIYTLIWPYVGKPLLIILCFLTAIFAYAMDSYGTHIDAGMVQSAVETNWREVQGLLTWQLAGYLVGIGLLPAIIIIMTPIRYGRLWTGLIKKPAVLLLSILLAGGLIYINYQHMAAFGRNHRSLRYLINPWMPLYYTGDYFHHQDATQPVFKVIGQDASIKPPLAQAKQPTLIFLVVGETARADNFSLNGYTRPTNPELAKLPVVSFRHATSCGTETAVSVPCMFSPYRRRDYSETKALNTSDVLDVLTTAGVNIIWRDNNSGSKGMAKGVTYQDVSRSRLPKDCPHNKQHCYDTVLTAGLNQWLAKQNSQYLLVVLHMYGSHGPGYYLRYPSTYARFKPECKTRFLAKCTHQQIVNAYDNTIVYTDHVLAGMIHYLQQKHQYNTALLYLSDHGESLGENGLYLHGMPWHLAPDEQKHIPFIWWMSHQYANSRHLDFQCIKHERNKPISQDDIFSTLLGLFSVQTKVYKPSMDIFSPCHG